MKEINKYLIFLIVSLFLSFFAGIVGSFIFASYVNNFFPNNNSGVNVQNSQISELVKLKRFLGIKDDIQANAVYEAVKPVVASIYKKKVLGRDAVDQIYTDKELLGGGVILTSDGWIASTESILDENLDKNLIVIEYGNQIYEVTDIIFDPYSKGVFLKIEGENMPVAKLGSTDELKIGQSVLIVHPRFGLSLSHISDLHFRILNDSGAETTDELSEFVLVPSQNGPENTGGILADIDGEVIGIAHRVRKDSSSYAFIPIDQFKQILGGVLRNNKSQRPYLGISYIDLSRSAGIDRRKIGDIQKGILIYKDPPINSPAKNAGLRAGDIISKIDKLEVPTLRSFGNILQDYQVGDVIELTVIRNNIVQAIEVYLGIFEDKKKK